MQSQDEADLVPIVQLDLVPVQELPVNVVDEHKNAGPHFAVRPKHALLPSRVGCRAVSQARQRLSHP